MTVFYSTQEHCLLLLNSHGVLTPSRLFFIPFRKTLWNKDIVHENIDTQTTKGKCITRFNGNSMLRTLVGKGLLARLFPEFLV